MRARYHKLDEFCARGDGAAVEEELIVEYTDAPVAEAQSESTDTMQCPLCGATLPKDAEQCNRCDWVRPADTETAEGKASDLVAVLLSAVPGLGHVYKGYRVIGLLWFCGGVLALGLGALAATATAGFGLGLIPLYWFAVMFHVYAIPDRVAPQVSEEGEEY